MKSIVPKIQYLYIFLTCMLSCSKDNTSNIDDNDKQNDKDIVKVNNAPGNFNLLGNLDDSLDNSVQPSFSWEAAIDSDGDEVVYDLYLDNDEKLGKPYVQNLKETTFIVEERLSLNTKYFWKIKAKDPKDASTESKIQSFSTRSLAFDNTPLIEKAEFTDRDSHSTVVFDNKVWVIGGWSGGPKNDVWNSSDGINWTMATENAEFSPRSGHVSVVFDNKIWVIGGWIDNGLSNDVWYSSDGINWSVANNNAPFLGVADYSAVVMNNKIWILGGWSNDGYKNDVWSSDDGISWVRLTNNAAFSARSRHAAVVYNDKLWVIAGHDNFSNPIEARNDVWYSSDGINWTAATENASFDGLVDHTATVYDNKIWIIGGSMNEKGHINNVWYSIDGSEWIETGSDIPFTGRGEHTTIAFENKLWLIGGWDGRNRYNDVWTMD